MMKSLPIEEVIPEIRAALVTSRCAVAQAPPGAGKTTRVPLALLDEPWLSGRKIVMLEPRRLAVRASAGRMAAMLDEPVGKTVGYTIRMERRCGPEARIEVVTEGILTRRIQNDPGLEGTGLIIFDEFHERNLNSDLGLALCLEVMEALRDDLRILVMSATLDVQPVSGLMGNAPVVVSRGRSWPVETRYLERIGREPFRADHACVDAVKRALAEEEGDILVFLPGAAEIRRVETLLRENMTGDTLSILPLYGNLSKEEQDIAIRPSAPGFRKVVLATSIAETSLTIEGVRIVVDSGLMRVPRFFPGTGMSRLETLPVARASADQRRGRAGRTGPGICYRLWSEGQQAMLNEFHSPEILNVDLARFALELAVWGVSRPHDLKWLDLPPEGAFLQARELLAGLGALDSEGGITPHGKELAASGIHPRLCHMILKGKEMGAGSLACRVAALLGERDFISFQGYTRDADIRLRLDILDAVRCGKGTSVRDASVNRGVVSRILKSAARLENDLNIRSGKADSRQAGALLAFAFPERIAMARSGRAGEFRMASGSGAFLSDADPLAFEKIIVAAELDGNRKNARIYLAAPYSEEELERDFGHLLEITENITWEKRSSSVVARQELIYGALVLKEAPLKELDPERVQAAMISGIRERGIHILPWDKKLRNWQRRVIFLSQAAGGEDLPDFTDAALDQSLESWLAPFINGVTSLNRLKNIDLKSALRSMLSWDQQQRIDTLAPSHLTVPSGSVIPLDYGTADGGCTDSPILAVRLQEMFGLTETPRIAGGEVPVTLHLLSPASRPMQVTKDLASFWKNTYHEVKKDLKGRYPKHHWPDDPLTAEPTNRAKTRKK